MKRKISILLTVVLCGIFAAGLMTGLSGCGKDGDKKFDQKLKFEYYDGLKIEENGKLYDLENYPTPSGLYVMSGSKSNSEGEIVIPDYFDGQPVVGICFYAFGWPEPTNNNKKLKKITIPKTVEVIARGAFEWCVNLEEVIFEEGSKLSAIGDYAFQNTPRLRSITLPENLKHIGTLAFCCSHIESVVIPKGVTTIWRFTFGSCSNLKSVILHDELEEIHEDAFANSTNIDSIIIPKSVVKVGNEVFSGWTEEQTIYFEHEEEPDGWGNPNFRRKWDDGCNAKIVWGYTGT